MHTLKTELLNETYYSRIQKYLNLNKNEAISSLNADRIFNELCNEIKEYFNVIMSEEIQKHDNHKDILERQSNALIGKTGEKKYYYNLIEQYIKNNNKTKVIHPPYYKNLTDAIYHENWGYPKISFWIDEEGNNATDLIIDRNNIILKENGQTFIQKQTISDDEIERIEKKLLLINKELQNHKSDYKEVYTNNNIRVTIYNKQGQERKTRMVFRKYIVKDYSLENLCELGTIPQEAIKLIEHIIKLKSNIMFTGEMTSGKTTMLNTVLKTKDLLVKDDKVCFMIQDDPEIQYQMFKNTAIIPVILNYEKNKDQEHIEKKALRSSAEYFVFGEARGKEMLRLFITLNSRGNRGNYITYHSSSARQAIGNVLTPFSEGDERDQMKTQLGENLDFIFHKRSRPDGSKILDSITQVIYKDNQIKYHDILISDLEYNKEEDIIKEKWIFSYYIDENKEEIFKKLNAKEYSEYKNLLKKLDKKIVAARSYKA